MIKEILLLLFERWSSRQASFFSHFNRKFLIFNVTSFFDKDRGENDVGEPLAKGEVNFRDV